MFVFLQTDNDNDVCLCFIGLVGLAISYALSITVKLNGLVVSFTETEKQMVSVERVMQYVDDVPAEDEGSSHVGVVVSTQA